MKKLHLLLAVFAILISCSKSDPENPDPQPEQPKQETITIAGGSDTAPVLGTTGGTSTVTFTASAAWSASVINTRASDWCSVSPTNGQAGTATITITVKENTTPDNRAASVTIKCGNTTSTIKVEQKQKDALTVSQSSIEVPAEGKEIKVVAKSNVTFTHTISTEAQSWIKVVTTKALKDSTLTFEIAKNESIEKRSGEIYLTSGNIKDTVKVHQAGEAPSIVLSKDEYILKSEGESFEVEVASNVNATMNLAFPEGVEPWIAENTTRAMSTNKYIFVASANETYDSRSAMIIFANAESNVSDTVRVTQAQKDAIVVAKSSYNVENAGGTIEIEVGHNVDYEYTITGEWITKVDTRAMTTDKLLFAVAENTSYDNREGAITFTANGGAITQEVKVYQSEKGALIISKKDYVINDAGGEITMEIQSNVEFSVTAPSVDWLHDITTKGLQTHTLKYTVDAYEGYESRTTQLYVTNTKTNSQDTLTITQLQKDAIVLAKSEYEFDKEGGNLDFEIQTNVDVTVSIAEDCKSWITQVETRALETKKLFFNVAACDTLTVDRTGVITISGGDITQTVKITQSSIKEILAAEREALIAFYNSTGGDNWTNNTNWCSDKPVRDWHGVHCYSSGLVSGLYLDYNNLTGTIPLVLENLTNLEYLSLRGNQLNGIIPKELAILKKLKSLDLMHNNLTGSIPGELGELGELVSLTLSDNQFSGSIPKEIGKLSKLQRIYFYNNNITGEIPVEFFNLTELTDIGIQYMPLTGSLPSEIGNLKNLKHLCITNTNISGNIPEEIGNLTNLEWLCLRDNLFTGSIPNSLGNLVNLTELDLRSNYLTGKVPASVMALPVWDRWWALIINQSGDGDGVDSDGLTVNLPDFSFADLNGETITDEKVRENKYSIFYGFFTDCPFSDLFTPQLVSLYEKCKSAGINIYSPVHTRFSNQELQEYINKYGIQWPVFRTAEKEQFYSYLLASPTVTMYDSTGKMIYFPLTECSWLDFPGFLSKLLGDDEVYESKDYSLDGTVKTLQQTTVGNGIDVVLMGDGYSDRMVADGTYDQIMNSAMEKLFTEEPYKSFKNHFNVYSVTAISKNEVYSDSTTTAFAGYFGEKSNVGGNDSAVFEYAKKAIGEDRLDNALLIVIMNSINNNAGTCYMYQSTTGDYGNGVSVSYFPVGNNGAELEQVLHHEACGHGFAKLGDEYAYEDYGQISSDLIESYKAMESYGWWKNVDFTNDPAQVKWAKFLADPRYQNDGLGVFEGGLTYRRGVWRPTENSIMRYNTGGFNAPSREAIYYRIHKLAYGPEWEYDYEKFVEYDAKNRKTESQSQARPLVLKPQEDFVPLHPPVIIPHTWREAQRTK